jgi:HTH-type transcriptional regulator/antitoxin HigA
VDAIKFRMEQLGFTQKDMVPFMGNKSKVSEVLNRKRPLTLAMMRALHEGLGISAEILLKESGAVFPKSMPDMDWPRFPIVEMAKRCWVPKLPDLKERSEEVIREFIEKAGGMEFVLPSFLRQGKKGRYNPKTDPYALTAWFIRVLSLARQTPLRAEYARGSLKVNTVREIARLSYFDNGPLLAKEYLDKQGIHLIIEPHLPKTYLDGAAILLPDGTPVIGLTLRYDRIDHFWFCLLHELAHVARHLSASEPVLVDDLDLRVHNAKAEDKIESEADDLARDALIPDKVWNKRPIRGKPTSQKIYALAEDLKIHPAIIAGRIRFERNNYRLFSRHMGSKQVRRHFAQSCQEEAA